MSQETTRTHEQQEEDQKGVPYLATVLAIGYSTVLNLRLPQSHSHLALPSLPLRHSNLFTLLPHVIYESILISRLSHSTFTSFGACLHLLKIPLLSTTYKYFNIGFKTEICKSLTFDLINYAGQFVLFYVLSSPTSSKKARGTNERIERKQLEKRIEKTEGTSSKETERYEEEEESTVIMEETHQQRGNDNLILMSLLIWIFISILDGVVNFVFEKTLSPKIHSDVQEYINKLELDQYFLLKSSGTTTPPGEILRAIPPTDRTMMEHQAVSLLINLPYFFSSASLISLPSDFILLDRLPMLSYHTKLHWLFGLIARRLLNSTLAYFLKS